MEDSRPIITDSRLAYLDALRAFAIWMVVAIHTRAYVNLTAGVAQIIEPIVSSIAVPIFFLCDGFLFVHGRMLVRRFDYRHYLINSARRLLIPWILFSLLYLSLRWVFELTGILKQELVVGQRPIAILVAVYGSVIAPQMYFLVSLFLIRTLAACLRYLATVPIPIVWICFVVYSFMFREIIATPLRSILTIDLDPIRHAFWGLQYYLLGALLARHHTRLLRSIKALQFAGLSACCLAIAALGIERSPAIFQYSYLLCAYFLFSAATRSENPISRIGRNSMGIYLLHAPALVKGVSGIVCAYIAQPIYSYFVVIAVTSVTAYLTALLIREFPYGKTIFGEVSKKSNY